MKIHAFALAAFAFSALSAGAQTAATTGSSPSPGQSWNPLGAFANDGVTFPTTYIGEVLGNPVGGYRQGAIYDALLETGITIDLNTLAHWQGATFTANALYPHGSDLTRYYTHDLNVVSNIAAPHNVRLGEIWLQQQLFEQRFSIRVGQIALDDEFAITTNGALYINSAFGAIPTLANDWYAPVYPTATPGVMVNWKPDDHWNFLAAVFNGNVGAPDGVDRNGTNFNFDPKNGALWIAEAGYTLNPPPSAPAGSETPQTAAGAAIAPGAVTGTGNAPGTTGVNSAAHPGKDSAPAGRPLSGTYKIGSFLNTGDFSDNRTGGTLHGDYGFYAVIDQELWHEPGDPSQGLAGFARCSCVPSDRNLIQLDTECGLNYTGLVPGRDKDLAGLGFVYTKTSDSAFDSTDADPARHYEDIVELTYQVIINDHLNVQPDVQYIINPGGGAQSLPNALVVGMRVNLTF